MFRYVRSANKLTSAFLACAFLEVSMVSVNMLCSRRDTLKPVTHHCHRELKWLSDSIAVVEFRGNVCFVFPASLGRRSLCVGVLLTATTGFVVFGIGCGPQ